VDNEYHVIEPISMHQLKMSNGNTYRHPEQTMLSIQPTQSIRKDMQGFKYVGIEFSPSC
jgi:hypothetical protein